MADQQDKKPENGVLYMPIGLCLGLSLGLAFGSMMGNVGVGMCFGLGIGLCFGSAMDAARKRKSDAEVGADEEKEENEE